jgi:hypothetical protein
VKQIHPLQDFFGSLCCRPATPTFSPSIQYCIKIDRLNMI